MIGGGDAGLFENTVMRMAGVKPMPYRRSESTRIRFWGGMENSTLDRRYRVTPDR